MDRATLEFLVILIRLFDGQGIEGEPCKFLSGGCLSSRRDDSRLG
jgi:hypothetical protein